MAMAGEPTGVEEPASRGDDLDDLQETFRSLQRANVNVYPFDPSGLSADGIMAARLDTLVPVKKRLR